MGEAVLLQSPKFKLTITSEGHASRQCVGEDVHLLEQAQHRALAHLCLAQVDKMVTKRNVPAAEVLGQIALHTM
jgi:hypothetical protein